MKNAGAGGGGGGGSGVTLARGTTGGGPVDASGVGVPDGANAANGCDAPTGLGAAGVWGGGVGSAGAGGSGGGAGSAAAGGSSAGSLLSSGATRSPHDLQNLASAPSRDAQLGHAFASANVAFAGRLTSCPHAPQTADSGATDAPQDEQYAAATTRSPRVDTGLTSPRRSGASLTATTRAGQALHQHGTPASRTRTSSDARGPGQCSSSSSLPVERRTVRSTIAITIASSSCPAIGMKSGTRSMGIAR